MPAELFKSSPCSSIPTLMYKDRFALQGEKPIRSQSTSLPVVGLLYLLLPKPMTELLHNTGSSSVAFFIISKSTKLPLRFCSSLIVLIKSSTFAAVGFVFISASFVFFFSHLKFIQVIKIFIFLFVSFSPQIRKISCWPFTT